MSLYKDDVIEIQRMIDNSVINTPEKTKQFKAGALVVFLIFLMFFGTICFCNYQKTIRQKNELQIQAYGEIVEE